MSQKASEKTAVQADPVTLRYLQVRRVMNEAGWDVDKMVKDIIAFHEQQHVKAFPGIPDFFPHNAGETQPITRQHILETARQYVCKDRQDQYGPPENSFATIAGMWSAYLKIPIDAKDVAALMVLLKVARIRKTPVNMDNWVDVAGYAACGGEIATNKKIDNS